MINSSILTFPQQRVSGNVKQTAEWYANAIGHPAFYGAVHCRIYLWGFPD